MTPNINKNLVLAHNILVDEEDFLNVNEDVQE
jgi:hypothetical protein